MAVAPRIPLPPQPVMPPEGIAPVTDPASTGTAPDASPTTMVLQYLKSRGYQPSSENVRRALEANMRDPGVIPGLRSDRPATDAEDQAAMAAAGKGGGARAPYVPSGTGGKDDTTPVTGGDPNTSAAPGPNTGATGGSGVGPLGMSVAAGVPLAALLYGASKIPAMGAAPPVAPGSSVPPPVDPGAGVPRVGGPEVPPLLPPPATNPATGAEVSPMEAAMQKAIAPPPLQIGQSPVAGVAPVGPPGSADMAPPRGPVEPVAPVVPFASDPALRTSTTLRGTPPPVRPVVRPRLNLRF